jgi:hypothetical protein
VSPNQSNLVRQRESRREIGVLSQARSATTRWLTILGLTAVTSRLVSAQEALRVIDAAGRGIPYALVQIGRDAPAVTDSAGLVRLRTTYGGARVSARRIGYAPFDSVASRGADGALFVRLLSTSGALDTLRTVAALRTPLELTGFYARVRREASGSYRGEFVTPEELEQRQAGVLTQLFYGRQFVTVGRSRPVVLTGRGGCLMEVLVDGRVLRDQSIDEVLSVSEVMAMEIYPSTANAPAELIPLTNRGSCGLVAIWTGPRR